jgi:hypothetical protein
MRTDQQIVDSLNKEQLEERKSLVLIGIVFGGAIGFIIGIVLTSFLHKYIVHPLGF